MRFEDLPRYTLAHLPTPIEPMPALTAALGGPRLFVKRDDCTGLATGGNKTRKLEFIVGEALARGADTLITEGGLQSNHCRQTAAAAARAGLACVLVLSDAYRQEVTGNLLLDHLLGARIVRVSHDHERGPRMHALADELRGQGRKPFVVPTGGSDGVGAMGYAAFMREVAGQSEAMGVRFDAIVSASGSGGTQGGMLLGERLWPCGAQIVGVSDGEPAAVLAGMVLRVARDGAARLGADLQFDDTDVDIRDEYYGAGYGIPSEAMAEAVRLAARTEGLLLDPVYSGKAMAGLVDLVRRGEWGADETVLFVHTGGTPALFAYASRFAS